MLVKISKRFTKANAERKATILKLRIEGFTYEEIGKIFRVSRQRIEQILNDCDTKTFIKTGKKQRMEKLCVQYCKEQE